MCMSGVYRHFKGDLYQVLFVGEHTETGEQMVVYVPLSSETRPGLRIRIRPRFGPAGFETCADNGQVRFGYVGHEQVKGE